MEQKQQEPMVNVKPQVPGILTEKEKAEPVSYLKNEELFRRAIAR